MRETKFIQQNQEKWQEFEKLLENKQKDPDKLNSLYIQITDDLSYSRTFYPNRSVRVYLNGLAQQLFYSLYGNKKGRKNMFTNFWKEDLPQVMYHYRKEFLIAFLVFALSVAIGALSSFMDPQFPAHILGESYVNMTNENIASGDPMKVYKSGNEIDDFLGITLNNLRVAFLTFIMGLFAAIGSIGILMSNGVMVGAFQWFFVEAGEFRESFLTIWVHGTLEISAIIIAGMAGLVMGKGLLFPGTYSRIQAFQVTARHGLKIFLGIAPIIITAGFIEAFLTRYTETPDIIRLALILLSLAFILGYFVWYPRRLAKRGFKNPIKVPNLPADNVDKFEYNKIKSNGEIFLDTFTFLKRNSGAILKYIGISTAAYASIFYVFLSPSYLGMDSGVYLDNPLSILNYKNSYAFGALNLAMLSGLGLMVSFLFKKEKEFGAKKEGMTLADFGRFSINNSFKIIFIVLLLGAISFLPSWMPIIAAFIFLPVLFLWMFVSQKESTKNFFGSLGRTIGLMNGSFARPYVLLIILVLIGVFMGGVFELGLFKQPIQTFLWNFSSESFDTDAIMFSIYVAFRVFTVCILFTLLVAGYSFLYYTLREINDAESLTKRIPQIGERKHVFGLEKEA